MPLRVSPVLANPRLQLAIAVGGFVLAVGGGLLLATSDFLVDAVAYGIQTGIMIFGAVAAGLVWLRRRPGNRVGAMLLALALVTALSSRCRARTARTCTAWACWSSRCSSC